jgi:hypothetical protein
VACSSGNSLDLHYGGAWFALLPNTGYPEVFMERCGISEAEAALLFGRGLKEIWRSMKQQCWCMYALLTAVSGTYTNKGNNTVNRMLYRSHEGDGDNNAEPRAQIPNIKISFRILTIFEYNFRFLLQ